MGACHALSLYIKPSEKWMNIYWSKMHKVLNYGVCELQMKDLTNKRTSTEVQVFREKTIHSDITIQDLTLSSFFFCRFVFRIWEITSAKNCVFHCVHKEIDNASSLGDSYSFRESGLQITLRLLSSSLGNTVLLHMLFLQYETQIGEKKTGQCFSIKLQFTCKTSDKSEKNRKTA